MVQRFEEFQRGNHCGHVSYEELEKACFGYMHNIAALEKRLEIACHVKADDKVGFDFAVLDKIDSLERERDELKEELRKWRYSRDGMMSIVEKLEADNARLRKRLELATDFYWTWANDLPELDVMNKAIDFRKAMELKEGE